VRADSSDGSQALRVFTIGIGDVNEAPAGTNATVTAIEDTPYVFQVGDFGFTDPDAGDTLDAVRIESLPAAGSLTLTNVPVSVGQVVAGGDIVSGQLQFVPVADANGAGYAGFGFSVRDSGGLFDPAAKVMTIDVTPVNDPPVITSDGGGSNASITVAENTATPFATVASMDVDGGPPVYSIVLPGLGYGDDAARFTIDPVTGAVSFGSAPDFESPADADGDNVYELRVQVDDGQGGTDVQDLSITVTNVNEAGVSAITDVDGASDVVAENAPNGSLVGITARATDGDTTDTIGYALDDDAAGRFAIDATTGVVTVLDGSLLDREAMPTHQIIVRADSSDGSFTTRNFSIALTDVNDNAPVIVPGQVLTVAENSGSGTALGSVAASDPDLAGALQDWRIVGGSGAGSFAIDPATGQVSVLNPGALDFEANPGFELLVTVSDGAQVSAPATVDIVLLTNVNEAPTGAAGGREHCREQRQWHRRLDHARQRPGPGRLAALRGGQRQRARRIRDRSGHRRSDGRRPGDARFRDPCRHQPRFLAGDQGPGWRRAVGRRRAVDHPARHQRGAHRSRTRSGRRLGGAQPGRRAGECQ
ncbi:MAG: cadherin domain-containing protein, partial [Burkholderiaceae bacterium]